MLLFGLLLGGVGANIQGDRVALKEEFAALVLNRRHKARVSVAERRDGVVPVTSSASAAPRHSAS